MALRIEFLFVIAILALTAGAFLWGWAALTQPRQKAVAISAARAALNAPITLSDMLSPGERGTVWAACFREISSNGEEVSPIFQCGQARASHAIAMATPAIDIKNHWSSSFIARAS